jgi:phosphate starvation-inducible PhoH-like protein
MSDREEQPSAGPTAPEGAAATTALPAPGATNGPASGDATLTFTARDAFHALCGTDDAHLRVIADQLSVAISARGDTLRLSGDPHDVALAEDALEQLYDLARQGYPLYPVDIRRGLDVVAAGAGTRLADVFMDTVFVATGKRQIAPKNLSQKRYIDAIRSHDLTFGIGPAGTGKTYLAMALAVAALMSHEVKRIILTRPAVEAGERLGFLPGDMAEKVNPYLRPLYDALYDMLDFGRVQRLIAENAIEVAPLAFMRGRTLNTAFVILDEAQNTTREQMRMFLTRLGFGARAVVTGDITQTDLPDPERSGLVHARNVLQGVHGIALCSFTSRDVVRHELVTRIINAYEADDERREAAKRPGNGGRSGA